MTVTRTRISGDYIRPAANYRPFTNYARPAGTSFFGRGYTTRTPVYTNSSWFGSPFRSFWHTPVYTPPIYTAPSYTASPIMPVPVVREPSPVADAILATIVVVGLVALVAITPYCRTEEVCHGNGLFGLETCHLENVCSSLI